MSEKIKTNDFGTISKVKRIVNGKEYIYWYGKQTINGKQRSYSAKTTGEVLSAMSDDRVNYSKYKTGKMLYDWIEEYISIYIKPTYTEAYTYRVKSALYHLKDFLPDCDMGEITPNDVQKALSKMKDSGMSEGLLFGDYVLFKRFFECSCGNRYMHINPCNFIHLPRPAVHIKKPLQESEVQQIILKSGQEYQNLYKFILFTGLRISEALGLSWDSIDFEHKTILVHQQLRNNRNGDDAIKKQTKSGYDRIIPISDEVRTILLEEKAKQLELSKVCKDWNNKYNLIFTNNQGAPLRHAHVREHFNNLANEVGRPDATVHTLRRTYATEVYQRTKDCKLVKDTLGHAFLDTTMSYIGAPKQAYEELNNALSSYAYSLENAV